MQPEQVDIVSEKFCSVLEDLAFLFVDPADLEELSFADHQFVEASISYYGDSQGSISLLLPCALMPAIAANVLGLDEDDDLVQEQAPDAVGEMLNIVCGQLLTAVYGTGPVFNLNPPQVQSVAAEAVETFVQKGGVLTFDTDELPLALSFEQACTQEAA